MTCTRVREKRGIKSRLVLYFLTFKFCIEKYQVSIGFNDNDCTYE